MNRIHTCATLLFLLAGSRMGMADEPRLAVLFLGDNGHHHPADRFAQLQGVLARRGIDLTYTEKMSDLNAATLATYDCLMIYANIERISADQERALLDYVAGGKGLVPVHCASYCFLNSDKYIELVGAQFQRHGTGVFRTTIVEPDHPVMRGFEDFESWDETYVHHKHNERDRLVLSRRVDRQGREPWTWVRTAGKGRVFYTAWGHDQRTWGHPGFQNLLERGIRWAAGTDPSVAGDYQDPDAVPAMTSLPQNLEPVEYVEARIPFYPPSERWGTMGKPIDQMQLPLEPSESQKHMVTPRGFHVELFAAEPEIGKPISMNWDERGRLWIAETVDYPNDLQPPGQGRDRIRICEDTDDDGRADRFTVFADKLSIPTSLVFSRGGVIVHQAPQTLFLKDTDGDDRADVREELLEGWSTRDTHAGPNNLHYGLDNWIWGMQGYSGFQGTVGGERHQFSQGFHRFKADGSQLEFIRSTNNNTWGLGFSEEGLVFGSTANRNPSVYMPIPNRYYEAVRGWSASQLDTIADTHLFHPITTKIRQVDHHGGYTAGAGHALYTARTYPARYWNRTAFVCGPTGHLVGVFDLKRDGSDFHSSNRFNLLASDDEWAAPIMAEVGPDGNVWVIDWYNFIVQHNPTPAGYETGKGNAYITDLRDKKHGRIYRVVYDSAARPQVKSLAGAGPLELVNALRSDNMLWRIHAQRLLVERGELDVLPALVELARDSQTDEIGLNTAVIHALWTMHGLGALGGNHPEATAAARGAARHGSAGVRRNAVAVLPRTPESLEALLEGRLLHNEDPHVRLATLLALSEMPPDARAGQAVAEMLRQPMNYRDRWIPDAATSAAARHDRNFLAHSSRQLPEDQLAALPTLQRVLATVAEHYARGGQVETLSGLMASLDDADPRLAESIVTGLAKGWPRQRTASLGQEAEQAVADLFRKLPTGSKGQLLRLAMAWGSERFQREAREIADALLASAQNTEIPDEQRIAAAQQLIAFRPADSEAVAELLQVVTPRSSLELSAGIIEALAGSESRQVGPALVANVDRLTPAAKQTALRVLLARPVATRALLDGIDGGLIQLSDLSLDQQQALAAHPTRDIARRASQLLARGGGLPSPDRQQVLAQMLPLAEREGDASLGKEVFTKQCAKCHRHGGEGNQIGPDLTGMAVHAKAELLTHILDPSRSVEGNYRVYSVLTLDGLVFNGLLASETKTSIELFDTEGKKHVVLREDIDELRASPKSLMPDGFEKQVSADDIVNLLEFLTQRGRFVPIDLRKVATAVSTRGMFYSEDAAAERLVFPDWSPKTFDGIPFYLVDPQGDRVPNVVMLFGPQGRFPPQMPKSVVLPCNSPAKAIHFLSGVSGWGYPLGTKDSVSMIVRLHYADGATEDHPLKNGLHFADYIRRVDVPESQLAFMLGGRQVRFLSIHPRRQERIGTIELVKGPDQTAPVVMAVTIESP